MWSGIKKFLIWFLGELGKFILAVLARAGERELQALLPIALEAVAMVAADPEIITNEEKRSKAFSIIKAKAFKESLIVADSVVNWALETALQRYKKERGL
jgi:hypothetical protein